MEDDNLTNESCEVEVQLSEENLKVIAITGIVASSISVIICILMITLMIVFKKYMFLIQRLILYLTISVLLNTLNQLLQRSSYTIINENDVYCTGLAIFANYSAVSILMAVNCGIFELYLRVAFKKEGRYIELIYIFIIYILPLGSCLPPYFFDAYGPVQSSYCSIVSTSSCKSSDTALILQAIVWWTPLYGTIIFAFSAYPIFFCIIKYERKKFSAIVDVDQNRTGEEALKEVGYFKYLPALYIFIDLIPIATRIHDFIEPDNPIAALWAMTALVKGLQGGIVALFITLDPKTFKRLTFHQLRSAIKSNILDNSDIQEYPARRETVSDSVETKKRKLTDELEEKSLTKE